MASTQDQKKEIKTMASSKVSLKLLIDKSSNKVLFAEAGKDFVDFLFNLLSLPIGTIVRLLTKNGMTGSVGNLYESIENLDDTYIQPNQSKDFLLKPKVATSSSANLSGFLLPVNEEDNKSVTPRLYVCGDECEYVTDDSMNTCPECGEIMKYQVQFVGKKVRKEKSCSGEESGFVKGIVTYMVTDDLVVQPMSTISCITLLNKFNVKEVGSLQEIVVDLGMKEGLKLLKASLQCKSVLASAFLKNNA